MKRKRKKSNEWEVTRPGSSTGPADGMFRVLGGAHRLGRASSPWWWKFSVEGQQNGEQCKVMLLLHDA